MTGGGAVAAYARRAAEYAELLGPMEATAAPDRALVERWSAGVDGPLLDLGCGPGHWTAFLVGLGADAVGMDPVPEFVEIARRSHPHVDYRLGDVSMPAPEGAWAGVLAWYSLIHLQPAEMPGALSRIRAALRPGKSVLLGFFDGERTEPFDHAVAPAWAWDIAELAAAFEQASLGIEHTERRQDPGLRPHGAVLARRPA